MLLISHKKSILLRSNSRGEQMRKIPYSSKPCTYTYKMISRSKRQRIFERVMLKK